MEKRNTEAKFSQTCFEPYSVGDFGARRRNRTVTELSPLGILSPVRLPVSPSGHRL
jgi:hypothetical protein